MNKKLRQLFTVIISLIITILFSVVWLNINKNGLMSNINIDSDLKTMIFNRGLGIVVIMSFVYFVGSFITLLTGIRLRIFGG